MSFFSLAFLVAWRNASQRPSKRPPRGLPEAFQRPSKRPSRGLPEAFQRPSRGLPEAYQRPTRSPPEAAIIFAFFLLLRSLEFPSSPRALLMLKTHRASPKWIKKVNVYSFRFELCSVRVRNPKRSDIKTKGWVCLGLGLFEVIRCNPKP